MNERFKVFRNELPTSDNAAEIMKPISTILAFELSSIVSMRCNQPNTFGRKILIQCIAIIRFIAYKHRRSISDKSFSNGCFNQFCFVRRGVFDMYGDRKTRAVCNCHDLGAFSPLGFSHAEPPFWAPVKLPSIKHSAKSSFPRFFKIIC